MHNLITGKFYSSLAKACSIVEDKSLRYLIKQKSCTLPLLKPKTSLIARFQPLLISCVILVFIRKA